VQRLSTAAIFFDLKIAFRISQLANSKPTHEGRQARLGKSARACKVEFFWLYNLRHSHASRLSAAGVSDLFVAQMIGHSTPSILQKYSKAIDEYRREAIRKLENMRAEHATRMESAPESSNQQKIDMEVRSWDS